MSQYQEGKRKGLKYLLQGKYSEFISCWKGCGCQIVGNHHCLIKLTTGRSTEQRYLTPWKKGGLNVTSSMCFHLFNSSYKISLIALDNSSKSKMVFGNKKWMQACSLRLNCRNTDLHLPAIYVLASHFSKIVIWISYLHVLIRIFQST